MSGIPKFIPVGELGKAFSSDSNILKHSFDLAGRTMALNFADGLAMECRFIDGGTLVWTEAPSPKAGHSTTEIYTATSPRPGIYLVDFIKGRERATSVSLVLDLQRGIVTVITAELPTQEDAELSFLKRIAAGLELTAVNVTFRHGSIDAPFSAATPRHEPTLELVGKRIKYTYSATEQYEHVYMNGNFYTWQCLLGSEQGLSDADRCHYYKVADKLYLFVWREKIVPTLGLVLIDLKAMQTTGKIFGYNGNDFGQSTNFQVGAKARIISEL